MLKKLTYYEIGNPCWIWNNYVPRGFFSLCFRTVSRRASLLFISLSCFLGQNFQFILQTIVHVCPCHDIQRWNEVPHQGLCWTGWLCSSIQGKCQQRFWWCCGTKGDDGLANHFPPITYSLIRLYFETRQIQKPAFAWEFYMYRQLDQRISGREVCQYRFYHQPAFSMNIYLFWVLLHLTISEVKLWFCS